MAEKNIFILSEFIDGDQFNLFLILLLTTTILFIYINQFFIELKDIIILILISYGIYRFT